MTPPAAHLVYSTFPSQAAAEAAGRALVTARLAACANILPGMVSLYHWEGALERGEEAVLLLKTTPQKSPLAMAALRERHPYALPSILVIEVAAGDPAYLAWIAAETVPR